MSQPITQNWQSTNHTRLTAALAEIKSALRLHAALVDTGKVSDSPIPADTEPRPHAAAAGVNRQISDEAPAVAERPAAIDYLSELFILSSFERDILLLCAGYELDATIGALCAAAAGDAGKNYPTFGLALAVFPESHWGALTPEGTLRRSRFIDVGAGPALTLAPLRIDERVLHYLAGFEHLDERLAGMVEPIAPVGGGELAQSHTAIVDSIEAAWSAPRDRNKAPAVQLCSADSMDCRPIAAAAAAAVGLRAIAMPSDLIPVSAAELDAFLRLWERDAMLDGAVLVVECEDDSTSREDARSRAVARLVERLDGPVVICTREPRRIANRPSIKFDVHRPTAGEQRSAWHDALPDTADEAKTDAIVSQFSMSVPAIRSIAAEAVARAGVSLHPDFAEAAWQLCRTRCRTKLDGLAQHIEPAATWKDLVLPDPQMQSLRQIAIHVRHRATVYDTWGFAAKSSRGLGIAALFAGASGTGKTMAAEVLANELRLDLYRIDLAAMVSKYIGETEKNLRKVFDAAEESGAILLFDEADALFGKRSEVKDSHDRYANIEVSYLLQRVEAYRGLAILTTNLKSAIDSAFLRRLRFVVQFPFPDAKQRAQIWERMFPSSTPKTGLEMETLAQLNIAGGSIRNIAVGAAFLAAEARKPVSMAIIREAAQTEFAKLERPLTNLENGSWT